MNAATRLAYEYLERDDVRPSTVHLVEAWNESGLLGIDLADLLEKMVKTTVKLDGFSEEEIDWYDIAVLLAQEVSGVSEDDLARRNEEARSRAN